MRIKKTSQYIEGGAGLPSYFTTETNTGMKWIDGKDIYRKVIEFTTANAYTGTVLSTGISNASNVFIDESHSYVISASDSCIYFINNIRPLSASTLNGDVGSWFRFNTNKSDIFYQVGTLLANSPAVITIEYTKN